jgi:hypothetical protein
MSVHFLLKSYYFPTFLKILFSKKKNEEQQQRMGNQNALHIYADLGNLFSEHVYSVG